MTRGLKLALLAALALWSLSARAQNNDEGIIIYVAGGTKFEVAAHIVTDPDKFAEKIHQVFPSVAVKKLSEAIREWVKTEKVDMSIVIDGEGSCPPDNGTYPVCVEHVTKDQQDELNKLFVVEFAG